MEVIALKRSPAGNLLLLQVILFSCFNAFNKNGD
jgi:hypothetical protein